MCFETDQNDGNMPNQYQIIIQDIDKDDDNIKNGLFIERLSYNEEIVECQLVKYFKFFLFVVVNTFFLVANSMKLGIDLILLIFKTLWQLFKNTLRLFLLKILKYSKKIKNII